MPKKENTEEIEVKNPENVSEETSSKQSTVAIPTMKITNLKNVEVSLNVGGIGSIPRGASITVPRDKELEKVLKHFVSLKLISIKV